MVYQYDIILEVTYFTPSFESKHRYRFENIQFPNQLLAGDEVVLPQEIRELGFDKPFEVCSVSPQKDQSDLLIRATTETPKPIIHAKLEELCASHEEYTAEK